MIVALRRIEPMQGHYIDHLERERERERERMTDSSK